MKKNPLLLPKHNLGKPMIIKPQKGKGYSHNSLRNKKLDPLNPHISSISSNNTLTALAPLEPKNNLNSIKPKPEKRSNSIDNPNIDQDIENLPNDEDDPMLHGPVDMFISENTTNSNVTQYQEEEENNYNYNYEEANNEFEEEEDDLSDRFAD